MSGVTDAYADADAETERERESGGDGDGAKDWDRPVAERGELGESDTIDITSIWFPSLALRRALVFATRLGREGVTPMSKSTYTSGVSAASSSEEVSRGRFLP
jgi:hypothetical protein